VDPATDYQATEEALPQHRTLFGEIYERSPDAMILVDRNGRIDRVNAQAEVLFGLPRERMTGHSVEMLIPERLRDRHSTLRADYMQHHKLCPKLRPMGIDTPLVGRRGDGSRIPRGHHVELNRDRAAARGASGGSGYYRTQTHRGPSAMLTREANHRTKNVLSIVLATVNRTKANSYEEFRTQFRKRIQGLSASQDLLVKNAWKNVPLTELVRSQFFHLRDLLGSRVAVSVRISEYRRHRPKPSVSPSVSS
jgi:PAS domain S-box-containing protein